MGVRHSVIDDLKLEPVGDNAMCVDNIKEGPELFDNKVIVPIFEEKFDGTDGVRLGGDVYYDSDAERNFAKMENKDGQTSASHKIMMPRTLASGVYTIKFDFCYFDDSMYGMQLATVASGGSQGVVLNILANKVNADQEELKPASRSIAVASELSAGSWNSMCIVVDTEKQTYDVYTNNQYTAAEVMFRRKAATNISSISLTPGGGVENVGLRKVGIDNLVIYEGEIKPAKSSGVTQNDITLPKKATFHKEEYLKRLDGTYTFMANNPYMLFDNQRALYDCNNNKVTAIADGSSDNLLVPHAVIEELTGKVFDKIEIDGTEYVSLKDVALKINKKLNVYDNGVYILAPKANLFSTQTEKEMIDEVKALFPVVSDVQKPDEYPFKVI